MACDALDHGAVLGFAAAGFLLRTHLDQLIAPFCQQGQGVASWIGRLASRWYHCACEGGEHAGIDRIGLCQLSGGTGEVAGAGRIDAGKAYAAALL